MKKEKKHIEQKLKDNPFKVPEGYFESFDEKLFKKIDEKRDYRVSTKTRVIRIIKPALAMAAGFALIFMLVYFSISKLGIEPNPEQSAEQNKIDYLDMIVLDDSDLLALNSETDTTINAASIENYLLAAVSDYELIYY